MSEKKYYSTYDHPDNREDLPLHTPIMARVIWMIFVGLGLSGCSALNTLYNYCLCNFDTFSWIGLSAFILVSAIILVWRFKQITIARKRISLLEIEHLTQKTSTGQKDDNDGDDQDLLWTSIDADLRPLLIPDNWPSPKIHIPNENEDKTVFSHPRGALSENGFALFVSDLHVSDGGMGDDFMLGHKNGSTTPTTSKTMLFAQMLVSALIRARKVGVQGVDLVLNGDTIDILELQSRATPFAHANFIGLLQSFGSITGNQVFYILGNHDPIPLNLPAPIKITTSYWNPKLNTYATHGHQFDSLNANSTAIGSKIAKLAGSLETSSGSGKTFPYRLIDNIKPLNYDTLVAYLYSRVPAPVRLTLQLRRKMAHFIGLSSGFPFGNNIVQELDELIGRSVIPDDGDGYLETEANNIAQGKSAPNLRAGTYPSRIVFGHTHVPCARGPYFNTGTWGALYSIHWPTNNRPANKAVETYLDLNPFLYIFLNPATNQVMEEPHYYNITSSTSLPGPLIRTPTQLPEIKTPSAINSLRRSLYFDEQ